jgi:hypothetical protein
MAEFSTQNPEFEVTVAIDGVTENIKVIPEETSDGAAYYNCMMHGKQLTEIRETLTGEWEQIWGNLSPSKVNLIGKSIKERS